MSNAGFAAALALLGVVLILLLADVLKLIRRAVQARADQPKESNQ